jgi:hypothetical protein
MSVLLQPGDILPTHALQPLGGGKPVRIGANRPRAQVIVVPHPRPCDACAAYIRSFEPILKQLSDEKADVLVVVNRGWDDAGPFPVRALVDDGRVAGRIAVGETPTVVVADRFGQVFVRLEAGSDHEFPDHDRVLETLLDIAIRCPECGVPDVPSPATMPEAGSRSGGMTLGV